eukprot:Skav226437  [mRNA]  locus=scaffold696:368005:369401:+ [translate_table: standard]
MGMAGNARPDPRNASRIGSYPWPRWKGALPLRWPAAGMVMLSSCPAAENMVAIRNFIEGRKAQEEAQKEADQAASPGIKVQETGDRVSAWGSAVTVGFMERSPLRPALRPHGIAWHRPGFMAPLVLHGEQDMFLVSPLFPIELRQRP